MYIIRIQPPFITLGNLGLEVEVTLYLSRNFLNGLTFVMRMLEVFHTMTCITAVACGEPLNTNSGLMEPCGVWESSRLLVLISWVGGNAQPRHVSPSGSILPLKKVTIPAAKLSQNLRPQDVNFITPIHDLEERVAGSIEPLRCLLISNQVLCRLASLQSKPVKDAGSGPPEG